MMCNGENFRFPLDCQRKRNARDRSIIRLRQLCFSERERASVVMWVFDVFGVICFCVMFICVYVADVYMYICFSLCICIYIFIYILRELTTCICFMHAMLKGHPYSYKVAFSLLIAVYSLG